jgi:uncharacterized cupin superfamily protein
MAAYTLTNLREVEDSAPKFGFAPTLEARFASGALGLTQSGLSLQRVAPNEQAPFGHRHKTQEEVYVVLAGSGRARVDDEVVELRPYDALRVEASAARVFEGGPEGLELLAFGAPHVDNLADEAVLLPDFTTAT